MNASDSLDVLWGYQNQYFSRGAHIEQLLLGLLTVGVAGWAFLHARERSPVGGTALLGKLVFTSLFSMVVAASYNVVYIMMMSTDITILNLESRLSQTITPFRDYYGELGAFIYPLYFITGAIVPILALASQSAVFHEVKWLEPPHRRRTVVVNVACMLIVACTIIWNVLFSFKLFAASGR